jgi:hypothetical protein
MVTNYNLNDVIEVFRGTPNPENFPVVITEYVDDEGPYIIINFTDQDYQSYYTGDTTVFHRIAQYLVNLKEEIESTGARVTFNIYDGETDAEVG